jgi:tetratricopeptide (TPR) repeat protein
MENKLKLLQEDVKAGDDLTVFLTTEREVRGTVVEITDAYLRLLTTNGSNSRFFEKMISGWEVHVVNEGPTESITSQSQLHETTAENHAIFEVNAKETAPPPLPVINEQTNEQQPIDTIPPVSISESNLQSATVQTRLSERPSESVADSQIPPNLLADLYKIEAKVNAQISIASVGLEYPNFVMPESASSISKTLRQAWDRIRNRYENAFRVNELDPKFGRIQSITTELGQLTNQWPTLLIAKRNHAVCLAMSGKFAESLVVAKAAARSKDSEVIDWLNLAYIAEKQGNDALTCLALENIYRKSASRESKSAWYVFVRLVVKFANFIPLASLYDALNEPKRESDDDLFCEAIVFLINLVNGQQSALRVLNDLKNLGEYREFLRDVISTLPSRVDELYRKAVEDWLWESEREEAEQLQVANLPESEHSLTQRTISNSSKTQIIGRLVRFNQNYGFLDDGTSRSGNRGSHFFHRSSVVDNHLLVKLQEGTALGLEVVFQSAEGPRGKVALQISQKRSQSEALKIAQDFADQGEYGLAINQLRNNVDLEQNNEAKKWYEKWREFARISGAPKGSNAYARARRLQLIEKDYERAISLFQQAIKSSDNKESAVKDLASLLTQLARADEAVQLLETHITSAKDKLSFENLLLGTYQKAGHWTKLVEVIQKRLRGNRHSISEKTLLLRQLAHSYMQQEKYAEAEHALVEAKTAQQYNSAVIRDLALCYYHQHRLDEAMRLLSSIDITDPRTSELISAIEETRRGKPLDSLATASFVIGANLSDLSSELSRFTRFFLDRCSFEGVSSDRVLDNRYAGSPRDLEHDTQRLETVAKELGPKRPRDRSSYFLSAARIHLDTSEGDHSLVYSYLCRSFTSRGDSAVAENRHLNVSQEWYAEALRSQDGNRSENTRGNRPRKTDASHALTRYVYSILGIEAIRLNTTADISNALEEVVNRHPNRSVVFDHLVYISTQSRCAGEELIRRLFESRSLLTTTYEYLRQKGVLITTPSKPTMEEFVSLWNELRLHANTERNRVCSEIKSLTGLQLTNTSISNGIELLKKISDKLLFDLDRQRVHEIADLLDQANGLCENNRFEEIERLCHQTALRCQDILRQIEEQPSKLSVEELFPVVSGLKQKIDDRLETLYDTARPAPELRLAVESYSPTDDLKIEVQIVIANRLGRGPAESMELILDDSGESADGKQPLFTTDRTEIPLDHALRGGEQRIVYLPLKLSQEAVSQQDFSIPLHARFRSRSGEFESTEMKIFPIRLNPGADFEEIPNPFGNYAEGSVVDDPEMFVGREALIESIARVVHAPRKGVIIYGQKRAGKSSILFHLQRKLQQSSNVLIIDIGNMASLYSEQSNLSLFDSLLWSILRGFGKSLQSASHLPELTNFRIPTFVEFQEHPNRLMCFTEAFRDFKQERSKLKEWSGVRSVLLIDEFSYIYQWIISGKLPDTFMQNWKAILQEDNFNVVVVGQDNMPKFKASFPNEFGIFQDERISYLKREDAMRLIEVPIMEVDLQGKRQTRFRERAVERILELTAGSPFYIQMLCNRLVEYMNRKRVRLVTEADVELVKDDMVKGPNSLTKDKFENLYNSGDTATDAISDRDALKVCAVVAVNSRTGPCNGQTIRCQTDSAIDAVLLDLVRRDVLQSERGHYYQLSVGLFKEWLLANQEVPLA